MIITLESTAEYEGIYLSGTTTEHTLKMVQQKKTANGEMSNGTNKLNTYIGNDNQHTMTFPKKNVVNMHVINGNLPKSDTRSQNGKSSSLIPQALMYDVNTSQVLPTHSERILPSLATAPRVSAHYKDGFPTLQRISIPHSILDVQGECQMVAGTNLPRTKRSSA